jgi:hypothetical protein
MILLTKLETQRSSTILLLSPIADSVGFKSFWTLKTGCQVMHWTASMSIVSESKIQMRSHHGRPSSEHRRRVVSMHRSRVLLAGLKRHAAPSCCPLPPFPSPRSAPPQRRREPHRAWPCHRAIAARSISCVTPPPLQSPRAPAS